MTAVAVPNSLNSHAGDGYAGGAAKLSIVKGLCLAATPTFAIMALLTAVSGTGPADTLCSADHGSLLSGMVPMYLLMGAFHLPPWLKLNFRRRTESERSRC